MRARVFILVLLCCGLWSCSSKVDEEFLRGEDLCLEQGGETVFRYTASDCQISFNPDKKQFRVMEDTMSKYYMVTCSEMPSSTGQKITADISWSAGAGVQTLSGVEFRVEKIEGDQIWMWSSKRKTAVSVRVIR